MTCSVASIVHQTRDSARNAQAYSEDAMNRAVRIEDMLHYSDQKMDRLLAILEKPVETIQVQTEENSRDYFMVKMETALSRGLISREQFTPMFEHFFGPAPLVSEGEDR